MTPPPGLPAKLRHFIGGASVPSTDGATFEVADPVTNQQYASVASGGPADLARAHRVAGAVESGMTWVNSHNVRDLRTPFGGVKASGLGREGGPHSLEFYTESRIVHIPLGDTRVPRFGA